MVVIGPGSGERVSGDFRDFVARTDVGELIRIRGAGISDQRAAFLDAVIARRQAGVAGTPDISGFAEAGRIVQEAPPPTPSTQPVQTPFQGPTRPGTDVPTFRQTGISVPSAQDVFGLSISQIPQPLFQGPVRPTTDVQVFRETGMIEKIPFSTVEPVERRDVIFGGAEQFLLEKRFTGTELEKGLAGFGLAPIRVVQFGEQLFREPKETTKQLGQAGLEFGRIVVTGEGIPEIGQTLQQETAFALGSVAFDVALFGAATQAPKIILKASDIFRTRGLKELPAVDIIDPKFFAGQTFPAITKGQTAGELLGEFRTILPGETRPGGFTAAPRPFARDTFAGRGTSELPGVFQSPLVSPRFLRISGEAERKLFSLRIFDTRRPTITRITPTEFELVPGVGLSQKQLAQNLKETQKFFEIAPKGKSFIPFLKTEKEAIIPFGTQLEFVDKRFFIKFEGRRVPLSEFKVGEGVGVGKGFDFGKIQRTFSIEDVSRSTRGISEAGRVTPLSSIGFVPRRSLFVPPSISRAIAPISSSLISPLISGRPVPPISRGVTPPPSSFSMIPLSSSLAPIVSRARTPVVGRPSIVAPIIVLDPFEPTPSKGRRRRKAEDRKKKPVKKKKKKRKVTPIRPSFTAIVAELKGGLPEEVSIGGRELGILPSEIRRLPS